METHHAGAFRQPMNSTDFKRANGVGHCSIQLSK